MSIFCSSLLKAMASQPRLLGVIIYSLLASNILASSLTVDNAWIPLAPPTVTVHAGYMELTNISKAPISIVDVQSPKYANIMMHQSLEIEGIVSMEHLDAIKIYPGETISLEPGDLHLMMSVKDPLQLGEKVPLKLFLDSNEVIEIEALVKRRSSQN